MTSPDPTIHTEELFFCHECGILVDQEDETCPNCAAEFSKYADRISGFFTSDAAARLKGRVA